MLGAVVSTTVIVCTALAALPHSSVAVQVRVMTSVFPQPATLVSLSVMVTLPQVSLPVATPVAALVVSSVHSTCTSAGAVTLGAVVSTTVMVCVPLDTFPLSSVAVQVRVITSVFPQPPTLVSLSAMVT
jgi:hypothetical protein